MPSSFIFLFIEVIKLILRENFAFAYMSRVSGISAKSEAHLVSCMIHHTAPVKGGLAPNSDFQGYPEVTTMVPWSWTTGLRRCQSQKASEILLLT